MKITLHVSPSLADVFGRRKLAIDVPDNLTVAGLLAHLQTDYPALNSRLDGGSAGHIPYNYFVNRRAITDRHLASHRLKDGDRIHILAPVVGG